MRAIVPILITAALLTVGAFVDVGLLLLLPCVPVAVYMVRSWWLERGVRVTDDEIAEFLRGAP